MVDHKITVIVLLSAGAICTCFIMYGNIKRYNLNVHLHSVSKHSELPTLTVF